MKRVISILSVLALSMAFAVHPARADAGPISASLASQLTAATGSIQVFVHATTISQARAAVAGSGLTLITTWDRIGVAAASGTASQVEAVRTRSGVSYVEADQPIRLSQFTSNLATRGEQARTSLGLDGRGVSAAIIDTGVDGTHPYFRNTDGTSAVKLNLKNVCGPVAGVPNDACFLNLTAVNDTDTLSLGGHGTHVAGIVAGRDVRLSDGSRLHGAAPAATIISLSVGAGLSILGADAALNWVLEHHANPCAGCPPIKVTNNSYGPSGGGAFDPKSATAKLQRALAAEGVVTVWAAGNDGPDNSATNPPGQDPTPGIIMVASYDDLNTGTREGAVSDFSSRGAAGRPSTYPDISAPGSNITSACRVYLVICSTGLDPRNGPGALDVGTFNTISGTSMATPHVVGIVAQLFQHSPNATPAQIENAIKSTAYKFTNGAPYEPNGTSVDKGAGLIDAYAAALALP